MESNRKEALRVYAWGMAAAAAMSARDKRQRTGRAITSDCRAARCNGQRAPCNRTWPSGVERRLPCEPALWS